MKLIYNIALRTYALIILMVSPFNSKAKKWIDGRKQWQNKLKEGLRNKTDVHWFHCASLGEFEMAKPVIEILKKKKNITILITFFSPSGYEARKNYALADYVCYLPLDTKKNAFDFISNTNISKAYFVKYEFWFHYFNTLNKNNIPFYIISATFRTNQFFFKNYAKWFLKTLRLPTQIFLQNNTSKNILKKHNINAVVAGDCRFDTVTKNALKVKNNKIVAKFTENNFTLIAGSSWQEEENIIASYFNNNKDVKLIIAPHDIKGNHIKEIESLFLFTSTIKYSQVNDQTDLSKFKVLIIDNIGILSNIYQYGDAAIIGGGFTGALHNVLEAATFGCPILFGPVHNKFPEANDLMENGAAHEFTNDKDLVKILANYINNNHQLNQAKQLNKKYIADKTGASEIIIAKTV